MYNFVSVVSSNVSAVGYEGNDLIVKFNSGTIYRYINAVSHFKKIISATSVGKYLNQYVKPFYRCEQLV
jgi:hypothetical protein